MKIIHKRDGCIGCGTCVALCPKHFEMAPDGKATLKNSSLNPQTGNFEAEVKEAGCAKEAAESCPAKIIEIVSK